MKLCLLILAILFFEIGTCGCKVVSNVESCRALEYTVSVTVRENEMTGHVITSVLMKFGVHVASIQTLYTTHQQVEYRLTCWNVSKKQLNETRDKLLSEANVIRVYIERIY